MTQRSKHSLNHYSPLVPQRIPGEEGRKQKQTVSDDLFFYENCYSDNVVHLKVIRLESDGKLCAQKELDIQAGFSDNITLRSEDEEFLFKWTIRQSSRELCKLSLNIIDKDTSAGLFRIDYVKTPLEVQMCII